MCSSEVGGGEIGGGEVGGSELGDGRNMVVRERQQGEDGLSDDSEWHLPL